MLLTKMTIFTITLFPAEPNPVMLIRQAHFQRLTRQLN